MQMLVLSGIDKYAKGQDVLILVFLLETKRCGTSFGVHVAKERDISLKSYQRCDSSSERRVHGCDSDPSLPHWDSEIDMRVQT